MNPSPQETYPQISPTEQVGLKNAGFLALIYGVGLTEWGSLETIQHPGKSKDGNSRQARVEVFYGLPHFQLQDLANVKAAISGYETLVSSTYLKETRTNLWRQR